MKIWLMSDIHMPHDNIPFHRVFPGIPEVDLCICAGDLIESDTVGGPLACTPRASPDGGRLRFGQP